jgi:acyl carrier protein
VPILNNVRRLLKKNGVMIPARSTTKIAAVRLPDSIRDNPGFTRVSGQYAEKIFQDLGYPFDLRVCIKSFPKSHVLSNDDIFEDLDFSGIVEEADRHSINLTINQDSRLDGFLVWLTLNTIEGELIDILENEHCWIPVYVPAFYPGIDVSKGDTIQAHCTRTLCENNINPDFVIEGVLIRQTAENIEFRYDLPHFEKTYKGNAFYQELFKDDRVNYVEVREESQAVDKVSGKQLREFLSGKLPAYMVPAYFVSLDQFPLTTSGKVDRKALPAPGRKTGEDYIAPSSELEVELVEIWSDVLQIEKKMIGVQADFFELGGHSIKAIEIVSKLKNKGIKIALNDVFRLHNIKELATYIIGKDRDKDNLKKTMEEAEQIFKETFGAAGQFLKLHVGKDTYVVLFVEDSPLNKYEDIRQFSRNRLQPEIAPHFIRPISQKPGTAERELSMDNKRLAELLRLETVEDISVLDQEMFGNIEKESTEFNNTILNSSAIGQYKVSPVQKAHLSLESRLSGTVMSFVQLDTERLQKAFLSVITHQGLLRSVLVRKEGELLWQEMSPPAQIAIPFIDLSGYEPGVKEQLVNDIVNRNNREFETEQCENSLPYRVVLFKMDFKTHLLAISLDHSIFDAMSREILEKQILDYYRLDENKGAAAQEKVRPYVQYIEQISKGPQQISPAEMIEMFDLKEYCNAQTQIARIIDEKRNNQVRCVDVGIKISEHMGEEKVWELSCHLFAAVLKQYFGLTKIPIKVISYGRKYQGNSYFDTIGEFLDLIPVLVNTGEESTAKILENIHEKVELASKHNINFMSLLFDEELRKKWKNAVDLIIPGQSQLTDAAILFNFPGKIPNDEIEHMAAQIKQAADDKEIKKISDFLFQSIYSSNSLHIGIFSTIEMDAAEIQKILEDKSKIYN